MGLYGGGESGLRQQYSVNQISSPKQAEQGGGMAGERSPRRGQILIADAPKGLLCVSTALIALVY